MPFFNKKNYSTVKVKKRDIPEGLWTKSHSCNEIVFKQELEESRQVCPKCDHHFYMTRNERIDLLVDEGTFELWDELLISVDQLNFTGEESYLTKLEENKKKTGEHDNDERHNFRFGKPLRDKIRHHDRADYNEPKYQKEKLGA